LLPEGIREEVTPGISLLGRLTTKQHPEFLAKKTHAEKKERNGSQSSAGSDDSIDKDISKIKDLGVKKFAQISKLTEHQINHKQEKFEGKFFSQDESKGPHLEANRMQYVKKSEQEIFKETVETALAGVKPKKVITKPNHMF